MSEHLCRVCGLYIEELPWGEDGISPTYEICPCCGVEFGNEDYTVKSAKQYRAEWMKKGSRWFDPNEKPNDWDVWIQLKDVPQEFL
ncbi:MAG: hypothetical protein E6Q66_10475 [Pedobacter sp.]|nr:MAG: hypothetical protein E6Q66_10475 [Pedobacter sp.]